ncbi:MAG: acetate kinase, partial [Azonexus sp.]
MLLNRQLQNPLLGSGALGALAIICSGLAQGAEITPAQAKELKAQVSAQTKRMEALRKQLAEADAKLLEMQRTLGMDTPAKTAAAAATTATQANAPEKQPTQVAQAAQVQQAPTAEKLPATVGESRPERVQQVAQIFEQPGVLTPAGQFSFEAGLQYAYSSNNRVSIVGYTIIPAITIGVIDVREVKRNTFIGTATGRWGVTNRLELEAKVP